MSNLISKLVAIQSTLNAPKNQYNNFGKYPYRNCEDILEAVKPLLKNHELFLSIDDQIEMIGDRFYVKAIATVTDGENSKSASAYAREELQKKGMDSAQLTGATSSYARKYALNGLFCIDDNKDPDSNEQRQQVNNAPKQSSIDFNAVLKEATEKMSNCDMNGLKALFGQYQVQLKPSKVHLDKLIEIKDVRKAELEVGDL